MSQHFLLSPAAKTLSLVKVMRMSDTEARTAFRKIRWSETEGAPVCPECGSTESYDLATRKVFKCKACGKQFSITSGTIFHSRKLAVRDILAAIAVFINGAKGYSALQLSRDLSVDYKTAFVMLHKVREAIQLARAEAEGVAFVAANVKHGSTVHADEASHWDRLAAFFPIKRINHQEAYSKDGACTNAAESFFSRMRRAEIGIHHHIAGAYLGAYAAEMAWREDCRREANGTQYAMVMGAVSVAPKSDRLCGYWQRRR